jgi:hypothetical protein
MRSRTSDMPTAPSGTHLRRQFSTPRLVDYTAERLRMLCGAAGFGSETDGVIDVFRELVSPWANVPRGQPLKWVSEVSDDNTPVEFSVTIADGRPEVRVLLEPQGDEPNLRAYRAAGLALQDRLEREFGAKLERFRQIQDLFLPEAMEGPFAVWSAVVFSAGRAPSFKAYFNPQARGAAHAQTLVEEGLRTLGLGRAWPALRESALRRGHHLDELKYLALDLTSGPEARVKVYVRHHGATPQDLEMASSAAQSYVPGEALEFARTMRGGDTRLNIRAPFTCAAFVGLADRPASTTVYVPVCAYARDDAAVQRRVHDYMITKGLDPSIYDSTTNGFANRPLNQGVGMQSWVALRRYRSAARLTVYLATEANRVHRPGVVPAPTARPADLGVSAYR